MSYLSSVKKATPQAPVLTIVGFPGVGKSTLAALFPSPIFVQAENATSVFETWPEDKQPDFFPELPSPKQSSDRRASTAIIDQLRDLASGEHEYKTVVIDAVTTLNMLFEQEVVEFDEGANTATIGDASGGFGKGYLAVAGLHAKVRSACEHLRKRGMAVVFLAHSGIAKVKNRPDVDAYSTWSLDMHDASRKIYVATSDAVLYLKSREFVTGHEENKKGQTTKLGRVRTTGERVIITSSEGTVGYVDAKNRYNMPQEVEVELGQNPVLQYIPFFNK